MTISLYDPKDLWDDPWEVDCSEIENADSLEGEGVCYKTILEPPMPEAGESEQNRVSVQYDDHHQDVAGVGLVHTTVTTTLK